jgi:predicted CXXCH cytochrome family protein
MMTRTAVLGLALLGMVGTSVPAAAQTRIHDCDYCHDMHGGGYQALTARDLQVNLCQWCHDPDAAVGVDFIDGKQIPRKGRNQADTTGFSDHISGTVGVGCWDCHNHQGESVLAGGDTNLVLVPAQLTTPNSGTLPVTFRNWSADLSFADTIVGTSLPDGTYRVCEVCHTATSRYKNTDTDAASRSERKQHNGRADCTLCHTHDTGFEGAGSCTTCHNSAQDKDPGTAGSRREVVSEFSRTSHHADAVQDSDCEVCHDQSAHQQGQVVLKNADNGSITYTLSSYADPSTNSTEAAKLTAFCLACHDADGAAGSPPFSDGLTPPVIDNNAWTSSSHNNAAPIAGCFGDGAFGCHATGHGSEKTTPAGTPATAPALVEQEEGFCFNCHDSDGPASSNMDGVWAQSVLWVTEEVRDGSDTTSLRNNRHDVAYATQQISGAKIECVNCHDPHSATQAQPFKTDPDPGDGRVPGTGQVMAGMDLKTEFCLDCHDGSLPTGVSEAPGSGYLTNVRTTHLTDGMGAGAGNANLMPGIGWGDNETMPCAACHEPHVSPDLFHVVDTTKSKDGLTDLPYMLITGSGQNKDTTLVYDYSISQNDVNNSLTNGYYWCNTCHDNSMGDNKTNCFACHFHGTRW